MIAAANQAGAGQAVTVKSIAEQLGHTGSYLRASEGFVVQFNDGEEATYREAGSPVADVEAAFSTTDFSRQPGGLPLNVERVCAWTWMCSLADVHPNTQGNGEIAQAFAKEVLP